MTTLSTVETQCLRYHVTFSCTAREANDAVLRANPYKKAATVLSEYSQDRGFSLADSGVQHVRWCL